MGCLIGPRNYSVLRKTRRRRRPPASIHYYSTLVYLPLKTKLVTKTPRVIPHTEPKSNNLIKR